MGKIFLFLAMVILAVVTVLSGCAAPAPAPAPAPTVPAPTSAPSTQAPVPAPKTTAPAPSSPASTPTATIKLRWADQNPEDNSVSQNGVLPYIKSVEQATNGRVKIDTYFAQTLAKGPDIWDSIKNGVANLGQSAYGVWSNAMPLADAMTLPVLPYKSSEQASGIFWQMMEKFPSIKNQFKDNKILVTENSHAYFFITSKKQIKTAEDIKGMKIRVLTGPPVDMMKSLGGVPVIVPMPDVYVNLQKGVIDGMAAPWTAVLSYRLFEVTKYFTYYPVNTSYIMVAMNWDTWNSLPPDIQKAIDGVSGLKASQAWGKGVHDSTYEPGAVRDQAKKGGYNLVEYTPTAEEIQKWVDVAGKPIWDMWVKNMQAKGFSDAPQILNTLLDMIKTSNP